MRWQRIVVKLKCSVHTQQSISVLANGYTRGTRIVDSLGFPSSVVPYGVRVEVTWIGS